MILDNDGHLSDYRLWNTLTAQTLADTLSIELTCQHYQILLATRQFFEQYHHSPNTRALIKYLNQTLPDGNISNALLQQLFNTGLVARHVSRIAGLPKPANCL